MYLAMWFKGEPKTEWKSFSRFELKPVLIGKQSKNQPLIKACVLAYWAMCTYHFQLLLLNYDESKIEIIYIAEHLHKVKDA